MSLHLRRIRSFVRRDGRMTPAQQRAHAMYWPEFGLDVENGLVDLQKVFGRLAPCVLEIGFGTGHSLLDAAVRCPEHDFLGVETHLPGIGTLLSGIGRDGVGNIRIFHAEVVGVLAECIPDASLAGIQVFFPDPWPKRRHHKRRLIQPAFVEQMVNKLSLAGVLHLATDWEDYAVQMMRVLSGCSRLCNLAGVGQYASRSAGRGLVTRFEARAGVAGRAVFELQFVKKGPFG